MKKMPLAGRSKGARNPAHPGFAGADKQVQSEGYSAKSAAEIIGYNKAHASAAAKKRNPRLKRTAGFTKRG